MRVLVCGGRDFDDWPAVKAALDRLHAKRPITLLIHGDARGADRLGKKWAVESAVAEHGEPADWDRYDRRAGPVRNHKMLREQKPQLVVAFPGGRGTAHMRTIAREAGVMVWRPLEPA